MSKKPLLTATFAAIIVDGYEWPAVTITRRTDRPYSHAWIARIKRADRRTVVTGFAGSRALAAKQTAGFVAGGYWLQVDTDIVQVVGG